MPPPSNQSFQKYGALPTSDPSYSTSIANMPDAFNPPLNSPERQSSNTAAIFNLTNSLLGGGTLSLPFVFAKCGIVVASFLVLFSMSLSIFSLHIITQLSQKLGCSTYGEVMEKTLGRRAKQTATYCVVLMLFLVIIAYLILLRDVASELVEYFTPASVLLTPLQKNLILTTLAILAFPLMTADSLHALRNTSYLGASCIILLLCCLCHKAYEQHQAEEEAGADSALKYFPSCASDVLTALPITFIAFLCHFNVNGIFCDLSKPQDIKLVISTTVGGTATIFLLFGFAGYVFAGAATADNVLKNFPAKDPVLMAARLGLSVTLMTQLPIMVIPCRKTLYPLLWPETNQLEAKRRRRAQSHDITAHAHARHQLSSPQVQYQQEQRGRASSHSQIVQPLDYFSTGGAEGGDLMAGGVLEVERGGFGVQLDPSSVRYGLTLLILSTTLMVSQSVPGVSVVWTVMGSTLTIVICFLLPGWAHIAASRQLHSDRGGGGGGVDADLAGCYAMLAVGAVFMLLCTPQALHNAFLAA